MTRRPSVEGSFRGSPNTPEPSRPRNRILFIDAYDSFSNNIVALLEEQLGVVVEVVKIDLSLNDDEMLSLLGRFDAVITGPGPGDPTNAKDIGLMARIWQLPASHILPVLGICLGFQSLACANGATIERLHLPYHGILSEVSHASGSIFRGVEEVHAIRYHSLHVDIGHSIQGPQGCVQYPAQLWEPTERCPKLRPLGWDLEDKQNGAVLMALEHTEKPFWGLQYHPESICTHPRSVQVIRNWWSAAQDWNASIRIHTGLRQSSNGRPADLRNGYPSRLSPLLSKQQPSGALSLSTPSSRRLQGRSAEQSRISRNRVNFVTVESHEVKAVQIIEALQLEKSNLVFYDTAAMREATGRYSIIGLVVPGQTTMVQYAAQSCQVKTWVYRDEEQARTDSFEDREGDIWQYLAQWMNERRITDGNGDTPFWGGLMGSVPYEVGLGSIDVPPPRPDPEDTDSFKQQDMVFAFVERSIVIDHVAKRVHIQTIVPDDTPWIVQTRLAIEGLRTQRSHEELISVAEAALLNGYTSAAKVTLPDDDEYCRKISRCQELIRAGESYELCLTAQTVIKIRKQQERDMAWLLYKRLRKRNPAPLGAYLRLGPATILSSSPERFLSWDRNGVCQMRPIKGTVQAGEGMTRKLAEEVLHEPKERAENLMILDLIRHDLHGILGSGNVNVTELMSVESYRTVWQLVSVIEGRFPPPDERILPSSTRRSSSDQEDKRQWQPLKNVTGLDILKNCLPPGSMTGAPKKRSCELLMEIEGQQPRGIYSGVLGYMCVSGSGDFSVVIRTAFRWDDRSAGGDTNREPSAEPEVDESDSTLKSEYDTWRIGAGGAITALSNEPDELQEMKGKLRSTMAAFDIPQAPFRLPAPRVSHR